LAFSWTAIFGAKNITLSPKNGTIFGIDLKLSSVHRGSTDEPTVIITSGVAINDKAINFCEADIDRILGINLKGTI
jgi:hypothetical protein